MTLFRHEPSSRSSLDQLLRSVMHATRCEASVLYRLDGTPITWAGCDAPPEINRGAMQKLFDAVSEEGSELLQVSECKNPTDTLGFPACADWPLNAVFMAFGIVRASSGAPLGIVMVSDTNCRSGLSKAQRYVMHTHAAQIAFHHDRPDSPAPPEALSSITRERLRLLESVLVNSNDAIIITEANPMDEPGPRIVYCNAAFTRTTGYTLEEVVGLTPRILQNANTSRSELDRIRAAMSRWQPVEVEIINQRRDGSEFWVEVSIVPVADDTGYFSHWVAVQRDISDRKRTEEIERRAREAHAENIVLEARLLERQRIEQELSWSATHDNLTRLYNRSWIMKRLQTLVEKPSDTRGAALLFLDLDRFKLVNDTLGHRAGDYLLIEMARRLESCLREGDVLARIGGDEFVVLIEDDDPQTTATRVAGRIIDSMNAPFRIEGQRIFTSSSIGIVVKSGLHQDPEELLRDADTAMYLAKESGSGCYAFFTDSMRAEMAKAVMLRNELRQVLTRQRYEMRYQPILEPATGRVRAVGVRLYWEHPEHGPLDSSTILGAAEELGIMRDTGRRMLENACQNVASWRANVAAAADIRLLIGVTLQELRHATFFDELQQILDQHGLPPEVLQLEIEASDLSSHPDLTDELLVRIEARGMGVVIARFACCGFSLAPLEPEGVAAISLDQDFMQRALERPRVRALMKSLFELGTRLGFDAIVGGVDTRAQYEALEEMGCQLVWGDLISRPLEARALAELLVGSPSPFTSDAPTERCAG